MFKNAKVVLFTIAIGSIVLLVTQYKYNYTSKQSAQVDPCYAVASGYLKDECYFMASKKTETPDLCEKINQNYKKMICFQELAHQTNNGDLCDLITDKVRWRNCVNDYNVIVVDSYRRCEAENIEPSERDQCYGLVAIAKQDPSFCQRITTSENHDTCLKDIARMKQDQTICKKITAPNAKSVCEIISSQDPKLCRGITNQLEKVVCLAVTTRQMRTCEQIADQEVLQICYEAVGLVVNPKDLRIQYTVETEHQNLKLPGKNFSFVHLGHTRTLDSEAFSKLIADVKKLQPNFVLHSGDLTFEPHLLNEWVEFFFQPFDKIGLPIYVSPSSHESYDDYKNYRLLVRDDLWYAFDVGDYHFIVLAYLETNKEQVDWLKNEINTHSNSIILMGGQENSVFQTIIQEVNSENVKLILGGDGQAFAESSLGTIPYLTVDEKNFRLIQVRDGHITYKGYSL